MLRSTEWYRVAGAEQQIPLRRYATPEEVADWVLHLAEQPQLFQNGSNIILDGGLSKV
jgi:NAD(P)-dependent dehydrogenase (short-subunit alcohol dehydrogenase family)